MVLTKIKQYGELVMFSHTLFSFPFAMLAMFIAADGLPEARVIFWIIIALVSGRTGANAFNRYFDRNIDAKNPRTANRHLPAKKVNEIEVLIFTIVCFLIFVFAAFQIIHYVLCYHLLQFYCFLYIHILRDLLGFVT